MPKKNKSPRLSGASSGLASLAASLVCVVSGLIVGFVLLILGGVTMSQSGEEFTFAALLKTTWEQGFKPIVQGGFYSKANMMGMAVRMEILQAAPLIMTGLSVAFAYKTGLFNIGAAGQYTVGAFMALYFAIVLKMPWWVCLIASALGGAVWGAIPGFFKAYLNVNEVITAIMFNWIGLYGVNTLIYQGGSGPMFNLKTTKTYTLSQAAPQALLPSFKGAHAIQDAFDYGVKVTGVTVHFANSDYDCGPIIAQRPVEVEEGWTVDQLEARIHEVEHQIYPHVAQLLAEGRVHVRKDGHVVIDQV